MQAFSFENVKVVFEIFVAPIVTDHFNGVSEIMQMIDHLPGSRRMSRPFS